MKKEIKFIGGLAGLKKRWNVIKRIIIKFEQSLINV